MSHENVQPYIDPFVLFPCLARFDLPAMRPGSEEPTGVSFAWGHKGTEFAVIASCSGCGVCCLLVGLPPFLSAEWRRVKHDLPADLREQIETLRSNTRQRSESPGRGNTPCIWLDPQSRQCKHYEFHPAVCRDFQMGGTDCQDHRRRQGLEFDLCQVVSGGQVASDSVVVDNLP